MSSARRLKTMSCTARLQQSARKTALLLVAGLGLASCAVGPTKYAEMELSAQQSSIVSSKPLGLQPYYKKLYAEGRRNEVLNLMELGLASYKQGHMRDAKSAFDAAISNINSVYADNEAAQKARSLWYEEGQKDFKGEPYERSMVFYYRGLIYLQEGDYENARASFVNGILQDSFAEEEQDRSDFAVLHYLSGWAARQMGNEELAQAHFDELLRYRPDALIPAKGDNTLVVLETGKSPRKLADGVGHYQLVYRRGKKFDESRAKVLHDDQFLSAYPMEDVFVQASTRGGREVDKIIKGKVSFKETNENVGSTLTGITNNGLISGYAAAAGGSAMGAYAGVSLIGVAALAISSQANPRADTRYWSNLPDTVHVLSLSKGNDGDVVEARFADRWGTDFPELTKAGKVSVDLNGIGFAYISSR